MRVIYRAFFCATVLGSLAGPALAADLPTKKAPPAPIAAPVLYNWTGFYAGVNAGVGVSDSYARGVPQGSFLTDPNAAQYQTEYGNKLGSSAVGVLGGVTLGYNYQINSAVLGLEADIDDQNTSRSGTINTPAFPPLSGHSTLVGNVTNGWFGTVRPRLGYAIDRTLIYVTGGLAYGQSKSSLAYTDNIAYNWAGSSSRTSVGYAVGGGVEYALTQNWRIKAEYLYVNLGAHNYALQTAASNPDNIYTLGGKESDAFSVVRVGVNYAF